MAKSKSNAARQTVVPEATREEAIVPQTETARALTSAASKAAAEGFVFDTFLKLVPGGWISGLFQGFGSKSVEETDEKTGEVVTKDLDTIKIETAPGMNVEILAAHQLSERLRQENVVAGKSEVWIQRGEDVRTPKGRMVTEYLIGVK